MNENHKPAGETQRFLQNIKLFVCVGVLDLWDIALHIIAKESKEDVVRIPRQQLQQKSDPYIKNLPERPEKL